MRSFNNGSGAILHPRKQPGKFALPLREFADPLSTGAIENQFNIVAGFLKFPRGLQRVDHAPSAFRDLPGCERTTIATYCTEAPFLDHSLLTQRAPLLTTAFPATAR